MTRPVALRGLLWCATVGLEAEEFTALLSAYGRSLASEGESIIHGDGLRALKKHQEAGDAVVIVTGSSHELATAFCAALGLENVRVVGSTFRSCAGAWVVGEHCAGARKVELLAKAGVAPPWAVVYTDSASDLPLLSLAERRCVVNASRGALRVLRRALSPGHLETVRWQ